MVVALIALIIGIGGGVALGAEAIDPPKFHVAVDQQGHMRFLSPELKGSFNTEPRPNEFVIELPSTASILALQDLLSALQVRIGDLENMVDNHMESRFEDLEERVGDLEEGNSGNNGNPVPEGLVLWFPMGEGEGSEVVLDKSGLGNDGFITGASWLSLNGAYALSFDGNDYVSIPDNYPWDLSGDFTIKVWVNRDETGASQGIVTHNLESTNKKQWSFYISSAGDIVKFVASSNGVSWDITPAKSTGAISAGQWYQLAITRAGSAYQIYINASPDGNGTGATAFFDVDVALTVGAIDPERGYLKGDITLLSIYNRALTGIEIQDLYNQEKYLFGM
jgi:hypothetical protein